MILPILIALLGSATPEVRCPVRLTLTGTVRGDSGVTVMFADLYDQKHEFRTLRVPFDTTVSGTPGDSIVALWSAAPGSHSDLMLKVSSKSGSRLMVCEESEADCQSVGKYVNLTKGCRIE